MNGKDTGEVTPCRLRSRRERVNIRLHLDGYKDYTALLHLSCQDVLKVELTRTRDEPVFEMMSFMSQGGDDVNAGEWVIGLGNGPVDVDDLRQQAGFEVIRVIGHENACLVSVGPGSSADSLEALTKTGTGVEYVERNRCLYALREPDDPFYRYQWYLPGVGVPEAWDIETGSVSVTVAILDSGVIMDHPDLRDCIFVPGYDTVDDDPDPYDSNVPVWGSHGTMVAGIIGGVTSNGRGISGINWDISIMPVRVLDGAVGSDVSVAEGIYFAVDNGADVISMSLGVRGSCGRTLANAIEYARRRGVILVAAAGNDGGPVNAPANHPGVIAVGALDSRDRITWYSSRGEELDIMAPGGDTAAGYLTDTSPGTAPAGIYGILTTNWSSTLGDHYVFGQGTSFAAAMVTGAAALLLAEGARSDSVWDLLQRTAVDLGRHGFDPVYGYGKLNVSAAIRPSANELGAIQRLFMGGSASE